MRLSVERRAALIARLAGYLERGLPLPDALAAISEELTPRQREPLAAAQGLAREGATLERVLERAGLLNGHLLSLLKAASSRNSTLGLRLVADELQQRASVVAALREAVQRPYQKLCAVLALGTLALLALASTMDQTYPGSPWSNSPTTGGSVLLVLAGGLICTLLLAVGPLLSLDRTLQRHLRILGRQMPWVGPRLKREANAVWLGALGNALSAGDDLPAALARAQEGLGNRPQASLVGGLEQRAQEGASLLLCCEEATFLPASVRFLVAEATRRPDLPRELVRLARDEREHLAADLRDQRHYVQSAAELAAAIPVLLYFLLVFDFVGEVF